jgi:hypothetical protein
MITNEDIEIYFDKCNFPFEQMGEGLWRVESPEDHVKNIVVSHAPPVLTLQIRLMPIPDIDLEPFYKRLLEINAAEIVHGAFGIENGYVVLIDTLQSENLDLNELQSSVQSLAFTVVQYYKEFSHLVKGA